MLPVAIHNLRGYDSHLILQEIGKFLNMRAKVRAARTNSEFKPINISVIPINKEKYTSFSIGNRFKFIDSFQFMSSSLDSLVKNLPDDAFKYTLRYFRVSNLI